MTNAAVRAFIVESTVLSVVSIIGLIGTSLALSFSERLARTVSQLTF